MFRKLIKWSKNLLKYAKSGGIVYINFNKVNPSERFNGKKILVTGGSSGIGLEIAKEYLAEGAEVLITGRRKDMLDKVVERLASSRLHTMVWDHSDIPNMESLFKKAINELGHIDICINNAGIYSEKKWSTIDENSYDSVLDINSKGLFFMCQTEGKYFVSNKINGRIINICSIAGIKSGFDPYSISKWGSVCITKGLAKELVKYGIIVNGVAPGNVVTNIHDGVKGKSIEDNAYMPSHLTNRYTLVEEVAGMVLYLSSDLGSNIVGQVVAIDGGWTLR